MKLLILGSDGQVGQSLREQLQNLNHDVIYFSRKDFDITDELTTSSKIVNLKPNILINAAAYTDVDMSENDSESAFAVNVDAVNTIAKACESISCTLIQISTDYVFDGQSDVPYTEESATNPLGVYGKTKLLGEEVIKESGCNYIIIRTSWLFSKYGKNFLKTILKVGSTKNIISVVNDEVGCPTYASDLARAILATFDRIQANKFESDIYNFSGESICSWHDFSLKIFKHAKSLGLQVPAEVLPIKSSDYVTLAKRPNYSVLDNTKFNLHFGTHVSGLDNAIEDTVLSLKDQGIL